jgi:hypothetical protein
VKEKIQSGASCNGDLCKELEETKRKPFNWDEVEVRVEQSHGRHHSRKIFF